MTATMAAAKPPAFTPKSVTVQTATPSITITIENLTSREKVFECSKYSKTHTVGMMLSLEICSHVARESKCNKGFCFLRIALLVQNTR